MGELGEPAGSPCVTTRSSDVAKMPSFRRTPLPQFHDLDIANDLARVGYRSNRRAGAGALDCVAGSAARCSADATPDRPAVRQARDRAGIRDPRAARAAARAVLPPLPPRILPLLVRVAIVPAFDTPAPPAPPNPPKPLFATPMPPLPPPIAPLLDSVLIVRRFDTPAPPSRPRKPPPPRRLCRNRRRRRPKRQIPRT